MPVHGTTLKRAQHPLLVTWVNIKGRCFNPNLPNYKRYGALGVGLYPEWVDSFEAFETWMNENLGPRPEGCSLDRINTYGNYEPGNLRWATAKEQMANRRKPPQAVEGSEMTHFWRVRTRLPERLLQHCRVLVRGRMNSILVEFEDGYQVVTSRQYVWRLSQVGESE